MEEKQQLKELEKIYRHLLTVVPGEIRDEKTPLRAAKAWEAMLEGYKQNLKQVVGEALFITQNNSMVVVKGINFVSVCEHHLLPIIGSCVVGYLPQGKILGLSKIPRIVHLYAKRLQLQERLALEIAEGIQLATGALGVGVKIHAQHLCMIARGVGESNAWVTNLAVLGKFEEPLVKQEFFNLSGL